MWWAVKQVSRSKVHVYPLAEEHDHLLDRPCTCQPETRDTRAGRLIVHKKICGQPGRYGRNEIVRLDQVTPVL